MNEKSLSVVLAGGGTTGHVAPLLALADCLRRRDPAPGSPRWARPRAWSPGWCPEAGYPLALMPRVPLPRRPSRRPGAAARPAAGGGRRGRGGDPGQAGGRRRRVRRLRRHPGLPGGPAARRPDRRARGQRPAGPGQPARRPVHPLRRGDLPRHAAARRPGARHAAAAADHHAGPPGRCAPRPGPRSAWTRGPHDAAGDRWVAGRAAAQRDPGRGGRGPRRGRRPGAARAGRGKTVDLAVSGGRWRRPTGCVEYLDRMDLAYAAADAVVCRAGAGTVSEVTARRAARGVRAAADRQRRAAAQRPAGGRRRGRPAGRRRRLHPGVGAARRSCPLLADPARLAAMGSAAATLRHPRRRRAAGRPGAQAWPQPGDGPATRRADRRSRHEAGPRRRGPARRPARRGCTSSGSAVPACPGIARILLARGVPVSGSDAKDSRGAGRPAGARGAGARRARRRAPGRTPTPWWCPPRSGRPTRSWPRPASAGLLVLHRSQALAAVMRRAAGGRGGRHPRQDHDHVDAHGRAAGTAGATRRSRSAAS